MMTVTQDDDARRSYLCRTFVAYPTQTPPSAGDSADSDDDGGAGRREDKPPLLVVHGLYCSCHAGRRAISALIASTSS